MLFITILFVVSAAMLALSAARRASAGGQLAQRAGLIFLGAAALGLLVAVVHHFVLVYLLVGLAKDLRLPSELAWAAAFFVAILVSHLLGKCFSLNRKTRLTGQLGLASVFFVYVALGVIAAAGDEFTREGASLACLAWDESGVRKYEFEQIDRKTGKPCVLVTPENEAELRPLLSRLGGSALPERKSSGPLFTSRHGSDAAVAIAWYSRTEEGHIELWDMWGFHPITGERLRQVTPEIAKEWQRRQRPHKSVGRPMADMLPGAQVAAEEAEVAAEEAEVEAESPQPHRYVQPGIDALLDQSAIGSRWTYVAWSEGRDDAQLARALEAAARTRGMSLPVRVLSGLFVTEGAADRALADSTVINEIGLEQYVDYLVLASLSNRPIDEHSSGLKTVNADLQLKVIRLRDMRVAPTLHLSEGAAAARWDAAAARARTAVFALADSRLISTLEGSIP